MRRPQSPALSISFRVGSQAQDPPRCRSGGAELAAASALVCAEDHIARRSVMCYDRDVAARRVRWCETLRKIIPRMRSTSDCAATPMPVTLPRSGCDGSQIGATPSLQCDVGWFARGWRCTEPAARRIRWYECFGGARTWMSCRSVRVLYSCS